VKPVPYPKDLVTEVRAIYRERQSAMREFNVANERRLASITAIDEACERHGISSLTFSRIARGVYGGRR
jgi:hypothetical protein